MLLLPVVVWGSILTATLYAGRRYRESNVGRGRTRRSLWARRIAGLVGYRILPCGCTYVVSTDRYGRTYKPDADAVEETPLWLRNEQDARIEFRRAVEQLKRCHRCGRHYHDTDTVDPRQFPRDVRYECWPEDEPECIEAFDAPVRDTSEVES